jgi:hypothetical protein
MTTTINASTTAGLVQTADTSGLLALQTAGTTAVTVNASQNVGIGTASPSSRLTTSGTTGTANGLTIIDTDYSNDTHQIYGNNSLHLSAGTGGAGAILFRTAGTERARFNSTGALVLAGGTTTANGIGITFPATQSASTNANTLDDYEEGTWTPTISSGITSPAYASQIGVYTKIGNVVYASARLTAAGGTANSSTLIISLPFPVANNSSTIFPAGNGYFNIAVANATNTRTIALDNTTTMQFVIQSATGQTAFIGTDFGTSGSLNFTLVYQV